MKRRGKKDTKYVEEDEDSAVDQQIQEDFQEKITQSKSRKSTTNTSTNAQSNPKPKSKKLSKTKSKDLEQSNHSDSQQNILQFRHGDDVAKDHIIPSFIRRWDGISNELNITVAEFSDMTPMLQAYWKVKSKHMNTVIMVEVGREFMVLENDALHMHEIFKKKLIKFSKFLMVYFWGKETEIAKKKLFDMQIPLLIMTQFDDPQFRAQHGVVRREITEVLTPALHLGYHDQRPRSRLLMALYHTGSKFAAVILDSESNNFFVEESSDDKNFHELRRVLNKYRPVELLLPCGKRDLSQISKQICDPYLSQLLLHDTSIRNLLAKFLLSSPSPIFKQLQEAYNKEDFSKQEVVLAFGMVWQHLQSLCLLQKIFFQGIFHDIGQTLSQSCCVFDSQVYQNLQVFTVRSGEEQTYGEMGSLMGFLDRCRTHHGKKLLHRWIDQPLISLPAILERQQAVKELFQTPHLLILHEKMQAYSRLEKRLGDIYHWVARHSQLGKLVLTRGLNYEKDYDLRKNPAVVKLVQIMGVLKLIKQYQSFLKTIAGFKLQSTLLRKYTELTDIEDVHNYSIQQISQLQCLPQIGYVADIITRRVSYDEITGNLQPVAGQSQIYDAEKQHVDRINRQLEEQLNRWKEHFATDKVAFVSVRARNEIQVPKAAIAKIPPQKDLIFSSQVSNGIRYVTHESSQLSLELMEHERAIAEAYQPFFQEIVAHFCQYRFLWDRYVQAMATLDVLMSLAQAARNMPIRCMPVFAKEGIEIKKGFHVNLLSIKEDLVPNSVKLSGSQRVLLLTGPNMGGKSTLLKQVCIFAILAQIGSYLPAESYCTPIYDQIFCRMGASDRILQGKSTFYVQLQQTNRILSRATERSLVVIDQLGRGTSTFDGMAIAQAILDCLIEQIRCYTLYSTHYTQITEEFNTNDAVRMMKMGYQQKQACVEFTYQLVDGVAQKSFACNVARIVGIPLQILKRAQNRSQKMHNEIHRKKLIRQACRMAGILKGGNHP